MKKMLALLIAIMMAFMMTGAVAESENAITVAVGTQFTTLDPALNTEVGNNYVINHIYAGMFNTNEDNIAVPELCESYTVSDDGLEYTFILRKDCYWSDGVQITAKDFEYSYLRALSYGVDNAWAINDMVSYIAGAAEYSEAAQAEGETFDCTTADHSAVGIEAVDDFTFVLKLIKPCAYLVNLMASNAWTPVRQDFAPQHDSLWAFEPGYPNSGAFLLEEVNENEKAVLVKNANYFDADTIVADRVDILVMPDTSAEDLAFQTGEVDMAMSISSESALMAEMTGNLWLMPSCSNYFLAINSGSTGPEWAKDVRVRKALAMAIDKDALVDVIGGELLYPVLNGYVPTGVAGVNGDFRAEKDAEGGYLTYDPEGAKALLAEAGYDENNPLSIVYKYSNNGMHGDVATVLQSMWSAIGVQVEFACVESGVFYDQLDQGDFEISRYGYVASDDAMQYLELWTTLIQVVAAVDDPEYDRMCEEARSITDKTAYYTALHAIEDYLYAENCYVIPLFNYTTPVLVSSGILGYTQHGGSVWFGDISVS